MSEEPQQEEWLGILAASRVYDVSPAWLYDLAYRENSPLVHRFVTRGKRQQKIEFSKSSLDAWNATRGDRFKKKVSDWPGRQLIVASI